MSGCRPPAQPDKRLRIIYIAGARNSGSTLLDAVLGSAPDAHSLGEVGGFHRYELASQCDCRQPLAACTPCLAVLSSLTASGELSAFHRLARLPLRERRVNWLVAGTRARAEYARLADLVFEAVATETGNQVLVDSSKNLGRAAALVHHSRHDVRVVHLVRDGRGYLASRRRREAAMGRRYVAPLAMAGWLGKNLLISGFLRSRMAAGRCLLSRYEDFVNNPAAELRRIGDFAGLDTAGLADALTGEGVVRHHLFEPLRRADYRCVRLEPGRLAAQKARLARNLAYWTCGGFLSALWGYDLRQSYLRPPKGKPAG